ncbi:MAG TPA: hypothetical protein VMV49_13390 [Candidatus Deferrimicrobium sp.]|nr:hypothetical protein [Candidatus Deferrimicrobium sp.]
MLFCKKCKKEVVIYSVNYSEGANKELEKLQNEMKAEGKLILFNPAPFGGYHCPQCSTLLEEKV